MSLGNTATIACGPDLGGDSISVYLTINSGRPWSYRGFATREALKSIGSGDDLAAIFMANQGDFAGRALRTWHMQPESVEFQITIDNVHVFGGFVNNG